MKILSLFLCFTLISACVSGKAMVYVGSTPAHVDVRDFLGISLSDSIDFIRWNLVIDADRYSLNCQYGLSRAGTNGFNDEKNLAFAGVLLKKGNYYSLQRGNKKFYVFEINKNLLHLLDKQKMLLVGNGGYSYALNNKTPGKSDQFNFTSNQNPPEHLMAFQGRTPCQELSALLGRESSAACDKLKWYIILFSDAITGMPTYYLEGGRGYKKESMAKGSWQVIRENGRIIYKLDISSRSNPMYLLKSDNNILFFVDAAGNLLVGNEDFSYTLNRTPDREPPGQTH